MLRELDRQELHVGLVPAPEQRHCGHCVRVVWCRNPGWYRELCGFFPRNRRRRGGRYTDSRVKRGDVREVIERLLDDRGSRSALAPFLLATAAERIEQDAQAEVEAAFGLAERSCAPLAAGCF